MLDKWTPFAMSRWIFTVVLIIAFMARILLAQVSWIAVSLLTISKVRPVVGMVYSYICARNLPLEPAVGLPHAQNWPRYGGVRGGRRRPRSSNKSEWRVPTFHPPSARVQVLVLCHQGHGHCILLHVLWAVQHPGILANSRDVLHNTFLYHNEKTN